MNESIIQIIIQAGAVGIAIYVLWVLHKTIQDNSEKSAQTSKEFTDALLKFNESITRMEDNHEQIEKVIKENSEVIKENSEIIKQFKYGK